MSDKNTADLDLNLVEYLSRQSIVWATAKAAKINDEADATRKSMRNLHCDQSNQSDNPLPPAVVAFIDEGTEKRIAAVQAEVKQVWKHIRAE